MRGSPVFAEAIGRERTETVRLTQSRGCGAMLTSMLSDCLLNRTIVGRDYQRKKFGENPDQYRNRDRATSGGATAGMFGPCQLL